MKALPERWYLTIVGFHDNAVVSWNGPAGEYYDTLYCDTSFGWHTNRQSVVVRYDPDPEEAPHVTLQSPDTVFVNDDDPAPSGGRPSWAAIGFRGHQMHGITQ